jgi:hypothetical protein
MSVFPYEAPAELAGLAAPIGELECARLTNCRTVAEARRIG